MKNEYFQEKKNSFLERLLMSPSDNIKLNEQDKLDLIEVILKTEIKEETKGVTFSSNLKLPQNNNLLKELKSP